MAGDKQHTGVTTRSGSHWPGIDALRGTAVLLVVLHHIHLRFVLNDVDVRLLLPPSVGRVFFWSGYYAVITFFVISGFLITSVSLRRWQSLDRICVHEFYWLRLARIWPCLLLLLAVLSVLHLCGVSGYIIKAEQASLPRAVVAALTFHLNWLEGQQGYLPGAWDVLWSLSVEEAFYLVFPLLCVTLRRAWLLSLIVALVIAGPISRVLLAGQEPWESYAYLSCTDAIAFGCLAAWMAQRQWSRRASRMALLTGAAAVVLVVVFRQTSNALGLPGSGLHITVLAFGVALILLAIATQVGETVLSRGTAWLQWAGRHSYEVYLTHMFVVLGAARLFKLLQPGLEWIWLWYAAMLAASVALGGVVSRFYSAPLNRALRCRLRARHGQEVASTALN